MIMLLYGKCGSGKTTTARMLASELRIAHTSIDAWRAALQPSNRQEEMDCWLKLATYLNHSVDIIYSTTGINKRECIIDTVINGKYCENKILFVHLQCSKEELSKRLKRKANSGTDGFIYSLTREQINKIKELPRFYHLNLKTHKLTPTQCVERIRDYMEDNNVTVRK